MIIPKSFYLDSQTLNSKFIEFVWIFDDNQQLICNVGSCTIYMEAGKINCAGDWIEEPSTFGVGFGHLGCESFLIDNKMCNTQTFPDVYKNFTNGQDLIPLVKEVSEFLKSI